ncbi:unnamed protein product [Orchesella dallaii]|uniref:Uncharacterized protein n=1 Tax=Orchesella dallaii TaxID=48710 RepID=A0ABP1QUB1_9HEXA
MSIVPKMSIQYEDNVEDEVDFEELLEDYEILGEVDAPNEAYNEFTGERSYEASEIPYFSHFPVSNRLQSRVSSQFSILLSEPDQFQDIVDSLPDDIVDQLSDFWSNMERSYAYNTFMTLENISKVHDQLHSYPDTFSHELGTLLEAPDDRIQVADNFKQNFNRLRYSRRIEDHIKQVLRQRVNELIIKMDGVIEEKYSKSKRDAYKLLSKGFLRTESEKMASLFGTLLQAQTDRFVDTVRFINGHYFKLIMEDLRAPIDLAWRSLVDICLLSKSLLCKYRHRYNHRFSKLHPNALAFKGGFKYGSFRGSGPWSNLPLLKQHETMGEGWGDMVVKSPSLEITCSADTCDICGSDGHICGGTPPPNDIKLSQIVSSNESGSNNENEEEDEGMESDEGRNEQALDYDEHMGEDEENGLLKASGSEDGLRPENSSGGEQAGLNMGRRATTEEEEEGLEDQVKLTSPTNQTVSSERKSKATGSENKKKKGRKTMETSVPPPLTKKEGRKSKKLSEKPTQKSEKTKDDASGKGSKGSRRNSKVTENRGPEFLDEEDEDEVEGEGANEMEDEDEDEGGRNISQDILKYYEEYMGEGYWEDPMFNEGSNAGSKRGSRLSGSTRGKGTLVNFDEKQDFMDSGYWDSDSSKMEPTTSDNRTETGKATSASVSCAEKYVYDDEEYYDFEDIYYLREDFYEKPTPSKPEKKMGRGICTPEPENLHFSIFAKDDDFHLEDSLLNKLLKRWGQSEPDEEEEEVMELTADENGSSSKGKSSEEQEKEQSSLQENKSQPTNGNDAASSEKQVPNKTQHLTFTSSVPPVSEAVVGDKKHSFVSSYSNDKWSDKVTECGIEPNPDEIVEVDENNNIPSAKLPPGEKRPLIESLSTLQDEIWHEFEYAFRGVNLNVDKMVSIVQEIIMQGYPTDIPSEESVEKEETSSEEEEEQQEEQEEDPCKKKKKKKKRCKCSSKNKPTQPEGEGKKDVKVTTEDSGGSKPESKAGSKSPGGTGKGTDENEDTAGGTGEDENSPEEEEAEDAEADPEEIVTTVTTHLEFPEEQDLEEQGSGSGNFDMTKDPLYYKGEYLGEGFWEVEHSDQDEAKTEDENDEEKEENDENDETLERINFNAIIRTKLQNWETTLQLEAERLRRHIMIIGIKAREELNLFRDLPFKVWERSKKQASQVYINDLSRDVEVGDVFRCAIDSASQLPGKFYIDTRDVKLLLNGTEPAIPLDYPESLRILPSMMEDEDSSLEEMSGEEE